MHIRCMLWCIGILIGIHSGLVAHDPFNTGRFRAEYAQYLQKAHQLQALSEATIIKQLPKKDTEFIPLYLMMAVVQDQRAPRLCGPVASVCDGIIGCALYNHLCSLAQDVFVAGIGGVVGATALWCAYG